MHCEVLPQCAPEMAVTDEYLFKNFNTQKFHNVISVNLPCFDNQAKNM